MVGKAYSASFAKSQFHCNATPVRPRYRGLTPEELGILFGLGNAARLIAGPLVNRIADLFGALRIALAVCTGIAVAATLGLVAVQGVFLLLVVYLAQPAGLGRRNSRPW